MIFRFLLVRKDTKAPIQGAKIILEHGETDGITDIHGRADIRAEWYAVYRYSVTASGFVTVHGEGVFPAGDVQNVTVEMGAWVRPTDPPPPGEEIIGTVGTSCDLLRKSMFGRDWYSYRQRYTGWHWSWDSELADAQYAGEKDTRCYTPPPPPPRTVEDVQKDVDILRGTLQGISSRVQDLVTSVTEIWKALAALDARISAWIEASLTEMREGLAALDARVKARIREIAIELRTALDELDKRVRAQIEESVTGLRTELVGVETRVKAWVEASIVAVLIRALDREVEEDEKHGHT